MPAPVRVPRRVALPLATAAAIALAIGIPACSSDDGTGPLPTPTAMAVVSGNNQTGFVGTVLTQPLVVRVEDGVGDDLAGATVTWTVIAGGGAVGAATSTTGADGRAQTTLTLGPAVGVNQVKASITGTPLEVTFTATGQEFPPDVTPAALVILSGNNQSATAGTALADSLRVQVRNAAGSALPNIIVTWAVTAGGGSLATASGSSDEEGVMANAWTLGAGAGANTVTASVVGAGTITATFTATGTTATTATARSR